MTPYEDLICFGHCGKSIFTYNRLSICPLCQQSLSSKLDSTPFTLPYPFVKACQYPCSVVLRPSHGDFLSSFENQRNLHIGLTSSNGSIFEYDENGLIITAVENASTHVWNQCILVAEVASSWHDQWDEKLQEICRNNTWTKENYHEESHNCFTFILTFLKNLHHDVLSLYSNDKILFSETFIVPKTQNAAKYITIHRKLMSGKYWVEDNL